MDNFLQGILASLSASLIVYIASKLLRKCKKPLKAAMNYTHCFIQLKHVKVVIKY
ncbi:hypothetical protein KWU72_05645 [Clostridioides difficile]|nr:hypothetical protein [Clostridioides difficile]